MKPPSQCQRILEALRVCDRPNWHFPTRMHILKYTNRISELRAKGYKIEVVDREGNTFWYHLDNDCEGY